MKLKILICVLLLISTVFSVCGCVSNNEIEFEGVIYKKLSMKGHDPYMTVLSVSEDANEKNIYVYDEIYDIPVTTTGSKLFMSDTARFFQNENLERIYFPWTIKSRADTTAWSSSIKYIFSPSTTIIVDNTTFKTFVIPKLTYDNAVETNYLGEVLYNGTDHLIPANVSYFFNYQSNPNNGYFFVDLIEETGKLTKPPYDPKRDGYKFAGWYKEAECTNQWNFETDTVTINFDKNGERVYEEIKLYAKWIKK